MNWKRIAVSLAVVLAGLFLAMIPASAASPCNVTWSANALNSQFKGPFTGYLDLNAEGITERSADIVINGVGCFTPGSVLEISFNAVMSVPTASDFINGQGTYWDFVDPDDALNINGVTVVNPLASNGHVTKIQISINSGTINPNAEVILKNLRFDVAGETVPSLSVPTPYAQVPDLGFLNAYVDTTNPATVAAPVPVGYVLKTVASAGVTRVGWGFEDGTCPFSLCPFPNKGGTLGYLLSNATWSMTTNPAWTLDFPFRRVNEGYKASNGYPLVNDPYFIGQTDLVVDVEDIMPGVTITLPTNLYICSGSTILEQWTQSNQVSQPGSLITWYQTVKATTNSGTLVVNTGYAPSTTACPVQNTIGVTISTPSGYNKDGNMQTDLRVVMGPGTTSQFYGDDVSASAIPRYVANITDSVPTREIIGSGGQPVQYFFLNPTQTVLLYPYVTNLMGWDSGIEIGNTGLDVVTTPPPANLPASIFGNTGQSGKLDFYFFPSNAPSFEYTVAAGVGRGLDTNGNLDPGSDFADTLNDLLLHAGHSGDFDGYIIIVAHFNFGHGAGMVFDTTGNISAIPALVLGGHCSYDYGYGFNGDPNAQLPAVSPLRWPACSSARQGDLSKLPEQLKN